MTDVVTKSFRGRDPVAEELSLSAEAEAALRQFSPERIVAYGVVQADMVELRGRVAQGEEWRRVCMDLAATALAPPESAVSPATPRTEANRLYRASAMIRMAQVMMIEDTDERRGIYEEAAELHARASEIAGGVERVLIDTPRGPVAGWYHRPRDVAPLGGVVVIGGVEGWAMDFAALGAALASRGVAAMVVDGPGQGETRLVHGHFLSRDWPSAYRAVVDELVDRVGNAPVGFVGNSLGGTVALRYAAIDARMAVVCDNGGPLDPGLARANSSFFRKMVAHCGRPSEDEAQAIWRTILPPRPDEPLPGALLVVHGAMDPLISTQDARTIFDRCVAADKRMVVFSDGDHCVYNHADDKNDLIADWVADRLEGARPGVGADALEQPDKG